MDWASKPGSCSSAAGEEPSLVPPEMISFRCGLQLPSGQSTEQGERGVTTMDEAGRGGKFGDWQTGFTKMSDKTS